MRTNRPIAEVVNYDPRTLATIIEELRGG